MDALIMHINAKTMNLLYHGPSKPETTKKADMTELLVESFMAGL
jgi:hypothetical protein